MTKRLWRALFHTPKHAQKPERQAPMRVSVSLLTMLACCAVLCASSLAWFNDAQAASVASIQAASYSLTIAGIDATIGQTPVAYTLPQKEEGGDNTYTFTITASGTASTGYCEIKAGETVYRTVAITPNEPLTLTIAADAGIDITFTAVWGTYSPTGDETLYGGETQLSLSENPAPVDDTETDENEGGNDEENGESTDENGESTDENGEPTDDEQPTRGDDTDNNAGSDPSGDNDNENPTGTPEPTTPSDDTTDTENPEGEQSPEPTEPEPTETPEETEQPTEPEPSENPEPSEAPTETPDESDVPTEETEPPSDPAPTQESDPVPQGEDAGTSE